MQRSKTYRAAEETFDRDELYSPLTAIKIAKDSSKKKFDETVDVVMRLGVDPRKADQMVRGTVNLPHGTGKTARVAVFAVGDKAEEAFRQSLLASQGSLGIFFSNTLVSSIMALGLIALFWPLISSAMTRLRPRPAI